MKCTWNSFLPRSLGSLECSSAGPGLGVLVAESKATLLFFLEGSPNLLEQAGCPPKTCSPRFPCSGGYYVFNSGQGKVKESLLGAREEAYGKATAFLIGGAVSAGVPLYPSYIWAVNAFIRRHGSHLVSMRLKVTC